MDNLTWFGVGFIILTVFGCLQKITQIGESRSPTTKREVVSLIIANIFVTWGLIHWGMTNG